MLSAGDRAPDFTLQDDNGATVSLAELLAEGPFVLYFYPADFTPVCTKQACMFRDVYPDLVEAGVRVVGVSPNGTSSHAAFRDKHSLPFPLLADKGKSMAAAYGAVGPLGLGTKRVSYFIESDGRIADAANASLRVGVHEAFVRRIIDRKKEARG